MARIIGFYQAQYFEKYLDYLCGCPEVKAAETKARDTFFLERHEAQLFENWLNNDISDDELQSVVWSLIKHRQNPRWDCEYYMNQMNSFKRYLGK